MSHDPNTVLLGATQSSYREVSNFKGEIDAGLAVRRKSNGAIGVESPGGFIGISVGRDLSRAGHTAVCRKGIGVPLLLGDGFTPSPGDAVHIDNTTGKGVASGGGATAVNAVYVTGNLSGGAIPETPRDRTPLRAAIIDFVGGL